MASIGFFVLIFIGSLLSVAHGSIGNTAENDESQLHTTATCSSPTALGMESGLIRDQDITASSWLYSNTDFYGPQVARFNTVPHGGWVKHDGDTAPWIQVDLLANGVVTGLKTQGGTGPDKRVAAFKVRAGTAACMDYVTSSAGTPAEFTVTNENTQTHNFAQAVDARYVRIEPTSCKEYCALRFEILGCLSLPRCPVGWEEFNGDCYYFESNNYLNYAQAKSDCVSKSASIVHIHSDAEQQFLKGHIFGNGQSWHVYLIGLTDQQTEGTFQWDDGSIVDYTKWYSGEPNNYGSGEDCSGLRPNGGGDWADVPCGNAYSYICEKPKSASVFENTEDKNFISKASPVSVAAVPVTATCAAPSALGIATGQLPGSRFTASTIWDDNSNSYGPQHGRLDSDKRWIAHRSDSLAPWIQVDLYGTTNVVSGVITQGSPSNNEYVSAFKVRVGTEECDMRYIVDSSNNVKVFTGNSDGSTQVTNNFPSPVEARYVRIEPTGWTQTTSLRFELLGCLTGFTPRTCGSGWKAFKATDCYYFGTEKMTMASAKTKCQSMGAKLASIHDQEDQDFIGLYATDDGSHGYFGYWVGLNDIDSEGNWEWTDGTPYDYNYWAGGEPNNGGGNEDCTGVWPRGGDKWNDYNCASSYLTYVCKK